MNKDLAVSLVKR